MTDLRIIKTRKALCDAFIILLGEKPFEDITVNELCKKAMVRRATFYQHFEDKYDFLSFFIRQTREDFTPDEKEHAVNKSKYSYFVYLFGELVSFVDAHKKLVESILKSNMLSTLLKIFSEEMTMNILSKLQEKQNQGITFSVPIELLASFYSGGIIQTLFFWLKSNKEMPKDKLMEYLENILSSFDIE